MRRSDLWNGVGCFGVVVVGVLGGVLPAVQRGRALQETAETLRADLAKPADGPEVIARYERELEHLKRFGEGRTTPIPEEQNMAGLIGQLGVSLEQAGLTDPSITTQKPKELDEAWALSLLLKMDGGFTSVYEAVRDIEGLPRLVRVGRLRITAAGEARGDVSREGHVDAEVLIEAFYAPKDASVADAGGDR